MWHSLDHFLVSYFRHFFSLFHPTPSQRVDRTAREIGAFSYELNTLTVSDPSMNVAWRFSMWCQHCMYLSHFDTVCILCWCTLLVFCSVFFPSICLCTKVWWKQHFMWTFHNYCSLHVPVEFVCQTTTHVVHCLWREVPC
jgi:hypothetical protein